ncbi:MAG: hypothetical protein K8R59_17435 [Thermoanaerobaculales bacterium]|nr:hypothetical protein [Thermoanaerobaculales bacterium]
MVDQQFDSPVSDAAPLHIRLQPGQSLHSQVLGKLNTMWTVGESHVDSRASSWKRVDERLRLCVDLEATGKAGDGTPLKSGKKEMPFERSIMIPMTYATLMSRMAQMYATATQRDPLIHLEPAEGGDVYGARLHEAVLRYDLRQSNAHVVLWQLLYDLERYGCCFLYDTWEEEHGWTHEDPIYHSMYKPMLPPHMQHLAETQRHWGMRREWNNWRPIAPERMIIDGAQDLAGVQNHRFIGHWDMVSILHLIERERKDFGLGGPYFNVNEAKRAGSEMRDANTGREVHGGYTEVDQVSFPTGKLRRLQAHIIPREWELAEGRRPERWVFEVWNGNTIVRAHRSVYYHEGATYAVGMADVDLHAPWTSGTGEQVEGMQNLINYLIAAHVVNTRKLLNDSMVYDPSLFDEERLLRPGPSRHIPLTKEGQRLLHRGFRIPDMYHQLRVQDTTGPHLQTAQYMADWTQRLTAGNDNVQGMLFEHKHTLGEVEKANSGSSLRIGTSLQLFERMVLSPAAQRALQNRQQFSSREQVLQISGQLAKLAGGASLRVSPSDLVGQYDYIPHTSTMAIDPARQSQMWGALLQIIGSQPQLLEEHQGKRLNPHALLEEYVQSLGVKYLDKFYDEAPPRMPPPMRVVPDDVASRALSAGNARPLMRGDLRHG